MMHTVAYRASGRAMERSCLASAAKSRANSLKLSGKGCAQRRVSSCARVTAQTG